MPLRRGFTILMYLLFIHPHNLIEILDILDVFGLTRRADYYQR